MLAHLSGFSKYEDPTNVDASEMRLGISEDLISTYMCQSGIRTRDLECTHSALKATGTVLDTASAVIETTHNVLGAQAMIRNAKGLN